MVVKTLVFLIESFFIFSWLCENVWSYWEKRFCGLLQQEGPIRANVLHCLRRNQVFLANKIQWKVGSCWQILQNSWLAWYHRGLENFKMTYFGSMY